jgi:spermidine/putrescine transport system substrate-binding protein
MPAFPSSALGGIPRRSFLKYAAVAGGMGVLAACQKNIQEVAGPSPTAGATRPPIADEPGVLKSYTWAGFDDPAIWKGYKDAGYPDPKFTFFSSSQQALAKTAAGYTWDTIHPSTAEVQDYLDLGAIQPWDPSLVANWADLNPALMQAGQLDGKQYCVVTDWGYAGVLIRTDRTDPAINSYSYLFDDDLAGHIAWYDDFWMLIQAGLTLGVESSIWDMSDADLEASKNFCIQKKKNLYNIWVDSTQMIDDVRQDNVWAAYAWPDAWLKTYKQTPTAYIRPKEGVLSWAEGLMLSSQTSNYYHAHEFLNAWTSVETGLWMITENGYGPPNLKVDLSTVDPSVIDVLGLDDPATNLAEPNSHINGYMPNKDGYSRAWDEVKAA